MKKTGKNVNCTQCNKTYYLAKWRIEKSKNLFCSQKCYHTFTIGQSPSEETRKKLSKIHKGRTVTWGNKISKGLQKFHKTHVMPRGENNPSWKGGLIKTKGYVCVYSPFHPRVKQSGYILRSHLVMEKIIGRFLTIEEVVHHKGVNYPQNSILNKQDDSPENLQLFKNDKEHLKHHYPKESKFGNNISRLHKLILFLVRK